jgi:hypothetical protein
MARTWNGRVRPFHGLTATLMMILSLVLLGMAPASAEPGNRTGGGRAEATTATTAGPGRSDHSQGNAGTQGAYDDPQPLSTADQNSAGANGTCRGGPYCSTRDGSASGNGNGDGRATGKPCAGCVGKADNKNPKGQRPGPSDGNNGYECDGNHGIARANPAHTGCTSSQPATQPATPPVTQPTTSEQAPGRAPEAEIKGVEAFAPPSLARVAPVWAAPAPARVAPMSAGLLPAGLLPNTGAGATLLLLLVGGLVLVGIGAVTLLTRSRTAQR